MIMPVKLSSILLRSSWRIMLFTLLSLGYSAVYSQTKRYLSMRGDDNNDGLSLAKPWKTIKELKPNTTYLFSRGDTFYFPIRLVANPSVKDRIVIDSYGKGPKPVISLYKKIENKKWVAEKDNVWKIDLKNKENYTGYTSSTNSNVGFIKVDNQIFGYKFKDVASLKKNWDFYSDSQFLYVYSENDLSEMSESIQIATNATIVQLSDNMEVRNIKIMGTGGHGIQGTSVKNITIKNVDITEIGGAILPNFGNGFVRYGNGIELLMSAGNCKISGCFISQVYDSGFTMQGKGENTYFENIVFERNRLENNEQSFEYWIKGWKSGYKNCRFINNTCSDAGFGWSHAVRPEKNVGVHILTYELETDVLDISIIGNKFINALNGLIYSKNLERETPIFKAKNNQVRLSGQTPIWVTRSGFTDERKKELLKSIPTLKGFDFKD